MNVRTNFLFGIASPAIGRDSQYVEVNALKVSYLLPSSNSTWRRGHAREKALELAPPFVENFQKDINLSAGVFWGQKGPM